MELKSDLNQPAEAGAEAKSAVSTTDANSGAPKSPASFEAEPFEAASSEPEKPLAKKMLPALGAIVGLLAVRWLVRRKRG